MQTDNRQVYLCIHRASVYPVFVIPVLLPAKLDKCGVKLTVKFALYSNHTFRHQLTVTHLWARRKPQCYQLRELGKHLFWATDSIREGTGHSALWKTIRMTPGFTKFLTCVSKSHTLLRESEMFFKSIFMLMAYWFWFIIFFLIH